MTPEERFYYDGMARQAALKTLKRMKVYQTFSHELTPREREHYYHFMAAFKQCSKRSQKFFITAFFKDSTVTPLSPKHIRNKSQHARSMYSPIYLHKQVNPALKEVMKANNIHPTEQKEMYAELVDHFRNGLKEVDAFNSPIIGLNAT